MVTFKLKYVADLCTGRQWFYDKIVFDWIAFCNNSVTVTRRDFIYEGKFKFFWFYVRQASRILRNVIPVVRVEIIYNYIYIYIIIYASQSLIHFWLPSTYIIPTRTAGMTFLKIIGASQSLIHNCCVIDYLQHI